MPGTPAKLGDALSHLIPLSPSLQAAMGFLAVFAGAANILTASTLIAVELFGTEAGLRRCPCGRSRVREI
jgi:H+/Cl- antiporter ClcA